MRLTPPLLLITVIIALSARAAEASKLTASTADTESLKQSILPPIKEWHGVSERLIKSPHHPWLTPAEKSGLTDTPNYQATMQFIEHLIKGEKRAHLLTIGQSPQGRPVKMLVISQQGATTAQQLKKNRKPTLLVQAGIHSGEIDGKDAGLMLLRDILKGDKSHLIDEVNWLFIPILSVDAHERRSPFNRVNQRGPVHMGWRTNAQNLNLNRDYAKLDTPELRSVIQVINQWPVDLYFDVHVTDGEDYQYDITYGFNREWADSPNISKWLQKTFRPTIDQALKQNGHLGGPLVFGVDRTDIGKGIGGWTASPRYSNGYGDVRQLPTVLVENHSLKSYKQRVLGTYIFLERSLKLLAERGEQLQKAITQDRNARPQKMTLSWKGDRQNPQYMDFAGIEFTPQREPLTGIEYPAWNGVAKLYEHLPVYWSRIPDVSVRVPRAYLIPPQYQEVIERLKLHGIQMDVLDQQKSFSVTELSAKQFTLKSTPFEGRQQVSAEFNQTAMNYVATKGTVVVKTDQALGRLAVALLDPRGPDSFFSWGFFNGMFQRTEYIEPYVMAPLIQKMLADNPTLKSQFEKAKEKDKKLAGSKQKQMEWFYQRSVFYDREYLKYPVLILIK